MGSAETCTDLLPGCGREPEIKNLEETMKALRNESLRGALAIIPVLLGFCLLPAGSGAAETSFGLPYGRGFGDKEFNQYDLHLNLALPWEKSLSSGWRMHGDLETILSLLELEEQAFKPSLMSNLVLSSPEGKVDVFFGVGFGAMFGETEFPAEDETFNLGGAFFLQGQAGVRVYMTDHFFAGCRYYHQSNGGIYDYNDSVNLAQVEIGWRF
jgi:hypothetical protein